MKDLSHLFWPFVILFPIIGTFICSKILTRLYKGLAGSSGLFEIDYMIIKFARMEYAAPGKDSCLPGYPNYADLKFSLIRHAAAFFVCAVLTKVAKEDWHPVFTWLTLVYALLTVGRFRYRKRMLRECRELEDDSDRELSDARIRKREIQDKLVRHSLVVVFFSFLCWIALYATWFLLPV